MSNVKLAVVYYSSTGTNYNMALAAVEAAKEAGAEVRLVKVQELAPEVAIDSNPAWRKHVEETKDIPVATADDIDWADAIIFSTPTRFGGVASQMKQFIDTMGGLWFYGKTVNKVVSAMTSAQNAHGGQEATILSLYTSMMHWGAILVPPGYTNEVLYAAGGNPYGTSVNAVESGEISEEAVKAIKHQAKRTIEVASFVKNGQA